MPLCTDFSLIDFFQNGFAAFGQQPIGKLNTTFLTLFHRATDLATYRAGAIYCGNKADQSQVPATDGTMCGNRNLAATFTAFEQCALGANSKVGLRMIEEGDGFGDYGVGQATLNP